MLEVICFEEVFWCEEQLEVKIVPTWNGKQKALINIACYPCTQAHIIEQRGSDYKFLSVHDGSPGYRYIKSAQQHKIWGDIKSTVLCGDESLKQRVEALEDRVREPELHISNPKPIWHTTVKLVSFAWLLSSRQFFWETLFPMQSRGCRWRRRRS